LQIGSAGAQTAWREIVPLKTNRSQVENILGKSEPTGCQRCSYKTKSENISISYSEGPCKGTGWNVQADTALAVEVIPKDEILLSQLDLTGVKIIEYPIKAGAEVSYVLQDKGEVYDIDRLTKVVTRIRFMPNALNNSLRCQGFPSYNTIGALYYPALNFYEKDLKHLNAFLDVPIIEAQSLGDQFKTYVIVYCGEDFTGTQYTDLLIAVRKHVYEGRKVSPAIFEVIDGGRRDKFAVDVFHLPKDNPPPVPSPIDYSCVDR